MQGIKQNLKMLGAALSLRSKRNEILASNIANSATPHYKARDINFEAEIKKYQTSGPIKVTDDQHIPVMRPASPGQVQFRKNINPSLDGNTVELAVEQLQFAENSMKYQSTLSFLSGKINTLMSAIKGE
ncbi:MAG: flagellar basal body rod protein FlgB [Alphaproteobacteria bacterium TMED93]|jgi:flagellar basal-body rod protein FlgB|nr:MAG: flagellar basal body rod protein FlgB [Alphaproteobacteria bacterium TMED93]|tara:strand:+ start:270 stop:656 length:387 start_codon:yes stop_codon:yes gene_type:complete